MPCIYYYYYVQVVAGKNKKAALSGTKRQNGNGFVVIIHNIRVGMELRSESSNRLCFFPSSISANTITHCSCFLRYLFNG